MLSAIDDDGGSGYGGGIGDKTDGRGDIFRCAGTAKRCIFVGNFKVLFRLFAETSVMPGAMPTTRSFGASSCASKVVAVFSAAFDKV